MFLNIFFLSFDLLNNMNGKILDKIYKKIIDNNCLEEIL